MIKSKVKKVAIAEEVFAKLNKRVPIKKLSEICRKSLPQYLYETNDSCYCTYCDSEFVFKDYRTGPLHKHLTETRCPVCNHKVTVQRNCGSRCKDDITSIVYVEDVNGYCVLRYYLYERLSFNNKNGKRGVEYRFNEVAREILNDYVDIRYEYYSDWCIIGNTPYAGYYFCPSRDPYRYSDNRYYVCRSLAEKRNIDKMFHRFVNHYAFEKVSKVLTYTQFRYLSYDVNKCQKDKYNYDDIFFNSIVLHSYDTGEKFISAGLSDMWVDIITGWDEELKKSLLRRNKDESIYKLLNLNRDEFKWFITSDKSISTYKSYCAFRENGLSLELVKKLVAIHCSPYEYDEMDSSGHIMKKVRYIEDQGITVSEYNHYVEMLNDIGAPLDKSNLYPKDFWEKDFEIANLINGGDDKKIVKVAAKIKKAMYKSTAIKELCESSGGLIVKVPESTEELYREGKRMHNCLGTYGTSVGDGKTQIFFIRKISEPDTPYYAMEYRNGEIRQLYTYNNSKGNDYEEVRVFALEFVAALAKEMKGG